VTRKKLGLNLVLHGGKQWSLISDCGLHGCADRTHERDAMKRSRSVVHRATKPTLEDEIMHLRDLDLKRLRLRRQSMFRRQAPSHLPRHLLLAVMAYQLQADELGGLAPNTIRLLKQIVSKGTNRNCGAARFKL
jgi:Protein of unknown function (DUF2924)